MRNPGRRATISDVATVAGVSRTMISLVLADHPRITEATKTKVRHAMADELLLLPTVETVADDLVCV